MRAALIGLLLLVASPAAAFECLNRSELEQTMTLAGAELLDEFVETDGDTAIRALGMFTMPGVLIQGDEMTLWRTGVAVTAAVMNVRGGGICLVALVQLTPWQADRIAEAVLQ